MINYFTTETAFYGKTFPQHLISQYGSPLYVYNETILRDRCREITHFTTGLDFQVNYSCKANSSLELLKIIHQEGLAADAMSPGEIFVLIAAGFAPAEIFYVGNNVSATEMKFAIDRQVTVSVDSVSQLRQFGRINPGGKVAVRFNPGVGVGHHQKVVTAGKATKFGITKDYLPEIKQLVKEYHLKVIGINQHLGSLFLESEIYLEGVNRLLEIALNFEDLEFIDFGGGMGIPYHKQQGQPRLDLIKLGADLHQILTEWNQLHRKNLRFKIEPGRYLVAECGVLLGTVHAQKESYGTTYIGTDLGFNVLARPVLYNSEHEIEIYSQEPFMTEAEGKVVSIVGNICESGDILAAERLLPQIKEGDLIGVTDAGAYGMAMASNYNNRLRPAEVLIQADGTPRLIRRRDSLTDLIRNFDVTEADELTSDIDFSISGMIL
jgi:diaminopimelate decarboxylase